MFGLAFPDYEPLLLILTVSIVIVARVVERTTSRRKWPTINQVIRGQKQFEVTREQLLDIELKAPRILRGGYVRIIPLMGDPITFSISSGRNFTNAKRVLTGFDPSRIKI